MQMSRQTVATTMAIRVSVALVLASVSIAGQTPTDKSNAAPTAKAGVWAPPRTADGQPDIGGYWVTQAFVTSLEKGLYAGQPGLCIGFLDPVGKRPTRPVGL